MLDLLSLGDTQGIEHADQTFGTEQSHQIVLQGNIELGFTGISLTSGTTTQLVINTSGLVTLGTDDLQSAGCSCLVIQLDIRTTTCHVGSNGYGAVYTGIRYDLRFQFVEFRIQDFVLDAALGQHSAQLLTGLDGNGTYQYGLSGCMCFLYRIHDSVQLLSLCLIYGILQILTDNGTVRGNDYNVHAIDLTELGLLCLSRTGHTTFFIK